MAPDDGETFHCYDIPKTSALILVYKIIDLEALLDVSEIDKIGSTLKDDVRRELGQPFRLPVPAIASGRKSEPIKKKKKSKSFIPAVIPLAHHMSAISRDIPGISGSDDLLHKIILAMGKSDCSVLQVAEIVERDVMKLIAPPNQELSSGIVLRSLAPDILAAIGCCKKNHEDPNEAALSPPEAASIDLTKSIYRKDNPKSKTCMMSSKTNKWPDSISAWEGTEMHIIKDLCQWSTRLNAYMARHNR